MEMPYVPPERGAQRHDECMIGAVHVFLASSDGGLRLDVGKRARWRGGECGQVGIALRVEAVEPGADLVGKAFAFPVGGQIPGDGGGVRCGCCDAVSSAWFRGLGRARRQEPATMPSIRRRCSRRSGSCGP